MSSFTLYTDSTGIITSYSGTVPANLVIPESCTGFSNSLFLNNTDLQTITIPSTFTTFGSNAFQGCSNLTEMTIVGDVTATAFNGNPFANLPSTGTIATTTNNYIILSTSGQLPNTWSVNDSYQSPLLPGVSSPPYSAVITATPSYNGRSFVTLNAHGGIYITAYTISAFYQGSLVSSSVLTSDSIADASGNITADVSGLTDGTNYLFSVTATNPIGSTSSDVYSTALTVPDAPSGVSVVTGSGSALVSWAAPENTGGEAITEYRITSSPGGYHATWTSGALTATVQNLPATNTINYSFTVNAKNSVGYGPSSDPGSGGLYTSSSSGIPSFNSVTAANGTNASTVTVSWNVSANGATITDYTVIPYIGSTRQTSKEITIRGSSATFNVGTGASDLTNSSIYTFVVKAIYATAPTTSHVNSSASNSVTARIYTPPLTVPSNFTGPPTATSSDNKQSTVTWSPPPSNGGSPIILYKITTRNSSKNSVVKTNSINVSGLTYNSSSNSYSYTVTGLEDSTSYDFTVIAKNAIGFSNESGRSSPAKVACFPKGTRITTQSGCVLVEDLKTGDLVLTADGRQVPIKVYSTTIESVTASSAPYLIPKGTFGLKADLKLSPLHAFQSRKGVWQIPMYATLKNKAVQQYGLGSSVTYYHLECPNFFTDNLVVDGCVVESFGSNQAKGIKTLYKFNETLNGFTRASQTATLKK